MVLILDLIHAAFKRTDTDMMGFATEALENMFVCVKDESRCPDQLENLLTGLTEEKGILYTLAGILNEEGRNYARKTYCAAILATTLESISPELYPHVIRLFKPIKGLVNCVCPLKRDGTTSDLNYDACKCLSLLVPHSKNFRVYLDDVGRFVLLMKDIYDEAASEDIQNFAKIILVSMGETVSSSSSSGSNSSTAI